MDRDDIPLETSEEEGFVVIKRAFEPLIDKIDENEGPLPYLEKSMAEATTIARSCKHISEVTALNLNMCRSDNISGLTNEFTHLQDLCLNDIGLQSIINFPSLPSLKRLSLRFNNLTTGLKALKSCHSLMFLDLSGNPLSTFDALTPLQSLKTLKYLDLFNIKLRNILLHRDKVFKLIESLRYLDTFDKNLVKVTRKKIIKDLQFEPIGL